MKGKFITFEGSDKAGKSTQFYLTVNYLTSERIDFTSIREPGGDPLSEKVRTLLLDPENEIEDLTELFLYEAARANLVRRVIMPSLREGKVVICDRYTDSTTAYQAYGRGLDLDIVTALNDWATDGIYPELTLLCLDRFAQEDGTRLENAGDGFRRRVEEGYQILAERETQRIKIVRTIPGATAEESIQRTFEESTLPYIKECLKTFLNNSPL